MLRSLLIVQLLLVGFSGLALAQPKASLYVDDLNEAKMKDATPGVDVRVVVPPKGELLFDVEVQNAEVVQVLRVLAERGNLQIVVKSAAKIIIPALSIHDKPLLRLWKVSAERPI